MTESATTWRLFVGIELPATLTSALAALQDRLRAAALFRGRYPQPENLHLTLKFLGERPAADGELLSARLATVRFAPFPVTLAGLGTFGGAVPRVLWLGADGGAALGALQRAIEDVLSAAGVALTAEPFQAHLTLARLRPPPLAPAWATRLPTLAPAPHTFTVAAFALLRSELTAAGPRYTVRQRFPAQAASARPDTTENRR